MALLERTQHLEDLARHRRSASAGQGRMVFVGGEAGIGKTSLVDAFCHASPNARVYRGACDPLATPRPLGPVVDMLSQLGESFAELLWARAKRERIYRAFLQELAAVPEPGALVVVEDAHWADDATLDLLRYVGRRIAGMRVLMLVTYRDDEVGPKHPFRVVLGDLAGLASTKRSRLVPLSRAALARLAREAGRDVDVVRLHAKTGGNPFYATEILAVESAELPDSVIDAVLARAGRLSPEARTALDAAAVIGQRFEMRLLERVARVPVVAIESCVESGVLVSEGTRIAFRHELARDALLSALPATTSVGLHRRVLEAMLEHETGAHPSDYASLAHHAEGAGDVQAVLEYAPAAARQAVEMHAHREAVAQYARALRVAERMDEPDRLDLLEAYARECYVTDRASDAIEAYRAAAERRLSRGELARASENHSYLAQACVAAGRNPESEDAVRRALRIAEQAGEDRAHAFALLNWSYLRMLNRDNEDAETGAVRALELAQATGHTTVEIMAHNVLGSALILSGRESEGRRRLEECIRLATATGREDGAAAALGNLGSGFGEVYRFAEADRWLERGIAYSDERDLDYQKMYTLSWRALSNAYQGRWDQAGQDATAVLSRPGTAAISRIMALLALGRIRTRRGDPEAWSALDDALELAEVTGTLQRVGPVRAARAELAWLEGDLERCSAEAAAGYGLASSKKHRWLTGELAYWRWKADGLDAAPAWIAEPFAAQISGRWQRAASLWAERGCRYEQARALAEAVDDDAALAAAGEVFTALGARPALERLAAITSVVDAPPVRRGPRPSTRSNPAGLTKRQMDVLRLLCRGLTNAEIAERLTRSEKTVEHHVSAILAKLDARNRTEAAQRAAELGLH